MRKLTIGLIVLVVLAGAGFAWYYLEGPCGVNPVRQAFDDLQTQTEKFSDAFKIAQSTPRISLSGPISDLQEIKRATDDVPVPACLEHAKELLVGGMQTSIDGSIAFMGQAAETEVSSLFLDAAQQTATATDELKTISECAPFCKADPYKLQP